MLAVRMHELGSRASTRRTAEFALKHEYVRRIAVSLQVTTSSRIQNAEPCPEGRGISARTSL